MLIPFAVCYTANRGVLCPDIYTYTLKIHTLYAEKCS